MLIHNLRKQFRVLVAIVHKGDLKIYILIRNIWDIYYPRYNHYT